MLAISSQFYFISSHFRRHSHFAMKLTLFILVCICMLQLSLQFSPSESKKDTKDSKVVEKKVVKENDSDQDAKPEDDPNEG